MTNDESNLIGWKAAEKFSGDAFRNKIEAIRLQRENDQLKAKIDELRAEIQRLQQIAQY